MIPLYRCTCVGDPPFSSKCWWSAMVILVKHLNQTTRHVSNNGGLCSGFVCKLQSGIFYVSFGEMASDSLNDLSAQLSTKHVLLWIMTNLQKGLAFLLELILSVLDLNCICMSSNQFAMMTTKFQSLHLQFLN